MPKPKKRDLEVQRVYCMDNPLCELFDVLEGRKWDSILAGYTRGRRKHREDFLVEPHHIWGGPHRWDITPNLISVSRPAHDYCHKFPDHGRIACLWVKMDKGELSEECRKLMRDCMGFDTIGILSSFDVTEEWVEDMRQELYERFTSYER